MIAEPAARRLTQPRDNLSDFGHLTHFPPAAAVSLFALRNNRGSVVTAAAATTTMMMNPLRGTEGHEQMDRPEERGAYGNCQVARHVLHSVVKVDNCFFSHFRVTPKSPRH